MANNLVLGLTALLALLPASLLPYRRRGGGRDMVFWALLAVALAGPAVYSLVQLGGPWKTGLAMALWLSIAISLAIFAGLAALTREGWRAVVWGQVPERHPLAAAPEAWLVVHILASLGTYGLATVAAVAGAAVFLQERALKRKQPTSLTGLLPSIAGGEALELRLLAAAELVLGLGIVTGMALQVLTTDRLLLFDHKTLLSLLAFAVIGALLILRHRSGLRGRRAARLVLLAYLLLTLAYPGVKFVTDVLLG
jgi:hypothetical protein